MFTGHVVGLRFHSAVSLYTAPAEEEEEAISRYVAVLDRRQVSLPRPPPTLQFSSAQSVAPLAKIHFSPRVWRRPPSISLTLTVSAAISRGRRRSVLLSRASILDS